MWKANGQGFTGRRSTIRKDSDPQGKIRDIILLSIIYAMFNEPYLHFMNLVLFFIFRMFNWD